MYDDLEGKEYVKGLEECLEKALEILNCIYCDCNAIYPCKDSCFMIKVNKIIEEIKKST